MKVIGSHASGQVRWGGLGAGGGGGGRGDEGGGRVWGRKPSRCAWRPMQSARGRAWHRTVRVGAGCAAWRGVARRGAAGGTGTAARLRQVVGQRAGAPAAAAERQRIQHVLFGLPG